jgi:hypothetical protein
MKSRILVASLFTAALFVSVIGVASQQSEHPQEGMMSPDMMSQHQQMMSRHQGMGGSKTGPGMMGMGHDSATMAQMGVIHELFLNHDRITRSVTNLPDGIRTVTESDDPQIRQLLRDHVATMRQRVDAADDPGLPIESEALHSIFRNYGKIETKVEATDTGVAVVQTSTDPETVAALQQHASEVTDFVKGGMAAMHAAMMKNGTGMMGHDMQGSMMPSGPNGDTAMSPPQDHEQHFEEVNKHGDEAMGFSHMKSTHHFRMTAQGGSIEVQANDPGDTETRDQIRVHLQQIAKALRAGDFSAPEQTHSRVPPGSAAMQRLMSEMNYRYEELAGGGRVMITTQNAEAVSAVHEFLRFQIQDHRTGDPLEIEKK